MRTVINARPPIKIEGHFRRQGKGPHTDVEVRVAYGLIHLPATIFMIDDITLTKF